MSPPLRAGLVGLGMMGRHHARVLAGLDGVQLVGVADSAGDPYGVLGRPPLVGVPLVGSVEELLALGLDCCTVAVPTSEHERVGTALAQAGVHALIEKPLAADPAGAARLAEAFAAGGLVGAVGHVERYNPALRRLRLLLELGELGELFQVATRRQGPFPSRIGDVGVVKDLATHDIDLTAWITRQPYRSVAARTAQRAGRPHEDLVAAVGVLADGTVTNHLVNWLSPMKERVTVVTGERGALVADTLTAELVLHANDQLASPWEEVPNFREGRPVRLDFPRPEPLLTEHECFRDAVLGRSRDVVTLAEGLATLAVAEAVATSARQGVAVPCPPVSVTGALR